MLHKHFFVVFVINASLCYAMDEHPKRVTRSSAKQSNTTIIPASSANAPKRNKRSMEVAAISLSEVAAISLSLDALGYDEQQQNNHFQLLLSNKATEVDITDIAAHALHTFITDEDRESCATPAIIEETRTTTPNSQELIDLYTPLCLMDWQSPIDSTSATAATTADAIQADAVPSTTTTKRQRTITTHQDTTTLRQPSLRTAARISKQKTQQLVSRQIIPMPDMSQRALGCFANYRTIEEYTALVDFLTHPDTTQGKLAYYRKTAHTLALNHHFKTTTPAWLKQSLKEFIEASRTFKYKKKGGHRLNNRYNS